MNNDFARRGWIALVVCCTAALTSTAMAQTNYYWDGGAGTGGTGANPVWTASDASSWYSTVNFNTQPPAEHTISGLTGWNNNGNGIADIGYVSTAGSGGANGTSYNSGDNLTITGTSVTQYTYNNDKGVKIALDPTTPINAYGVVFSYDSSNGTVEQNSRYSLTGGTLNLGAGGLAIDLSNTAGVTTGGFVSSVYSSINTMASNGGTLNINAIYNPSSFGATSYTNDWIALSGTNSYNTLHVGPGGGYGSGANSAINEVAIQQPSAAGSFSGTLGGGTGTIQNLVLDNYGGLEYMGSDSSTLMINNISVNPTATGVTKSLTYGLLSQWVTHIGGGYATNGASTPAMVLGPITGQGDVVLGQAGGGSGGLARLLLTATCNYTGDTYLIQYSTRGPNNNGTQGVPFVTLGVNNALPTGTNLIFGNYYQSGNSGVFDLGGFTQQVASIGSMAIPSGTSINDFYAGIANSNSASMGTLILANTSSTANWVESQFHGTIGANYYNIYNPTTGVGNPYTPATYNNLSLVLAASNQASLTLGVADIGTAPPGNPLSESNTYNGGTTVNGGMLFVATAGVYNDGQGHGQPNNGFGLGTSLAATNSITGVIAAGGTATAAGLVTNWAGLNAPNSATGTGWVMVNGAGTIGGSRFGGAIGMPDSVAYAQGARGQVSGSTLGAGRVTINGGTLLPGGGYFVDNSGGGAGGYVNTGTNFTPTSGPTFHVLGDLVINAGSTVNFNFDGYNTDQIAVGGVLATANASPSNPIYLNLNNLGSMANGLPLFYFNNTAGTAPTGLSPIVPGDFSITAAGAVDSNWTYSLVENSSSTAFNLQINQNSGVAPPNGVIWSGTASSGLWNNSVQNFTLNGTPTTSGTDVVTFDNTGVKTVNITAAGVSPNGVYFKNQAGNAYKVQGGPLLTGFLSVTNGGSVELANSGNTYGGTTYIANQSTLQADTATSVSPSSYVEIQDTSALVLNFSGTMGNTVHFNPGPSEGGAATAINVTGTNTVTLSGPLYSDYVGVSSAGLVKQGPGTLVVTNTGGNDSGATYVDQGTLHVLNTNGNPGQNYDPLGDGNMYVGQFGTNSVPASTATLWLDNVRAGVNQNSYLTNKRLGSFDIYGGTTGSVSGGTSAPGSTIQATGNSSLSSQNVTVVEENTSASTVTYAKGSVFFTAVNAGDTLTLNNYVQQFDPSTTTGYYADCLTGSNIGTYGGSGGTVSTAVPNTTSTSFGQTMTINVNGAGKVVLKDGATGNSNAAFGGAWQVSNGMLQVGPLQFNPNYNANFTSATYGNAGVWNGPTGEALNALGFMTPRTATTSSIVGNPDCPTTATIQPGGTLAVAIDQINPLDPTLVPGYYLINFNPTPGYLRTSVVLAGGAVAATGYEATFYQESQGTEAEITSANNPVTARFGGNFTVSASGGSVLTYDPNGQATDSLGNTITSDNQERTVELVGGLRNLASASWGYNANTNIAYATNWNGPLTVASAGTIGGTFNIKRSGGYVSVTPGASITVQQYSTVNISNDDTSTMTVSTSGASYGQMQYNQVLPVLNNVLSSGTNSVAIINSGTFNVNAGTQTLGAITSDAPGTFNVTGTATAIAPSISQGTANVAPAATLTLTGPVGASAPSMIVSNSGNLNVTGGSHTVGSVGSSGTTSVANGTLTIANSASQSVVNVNAGGKLALTSANYQVGNTAANGLTTGSLVIAQTNGSFTGKIDLGSASMLVTNGNAATIYSQIQQASGALSGPLTWTGSGITSNAAASAYVSHSGSYTSAVGYYDTGAGIKVGLALPGDLKLGGAVTSSDLATVEQNFGQSTVGWSGGDFYYNTTVDGKDVAAATACYSLAQPQVLVASKSARPMGVLQPLDTGTPGPIIEYNDQTGLLYIDNTNPDGNGLETFGVYLKSPSGDIPVASALSDPTTGVLGGLTFYDGSYGYGYTPALFTAALNQSVQWESTAPQEEDLPAGVYPLAQLPKGLQASDFGNSLDGLNNSVGSVFFADDNGTLTNAQVAIVPEPGTFALLAAGMAAIGVACRRHRALHKKGAA